MDIRTLSLSFDLPLYTREIPQWRGAFAELAGVENDLFHNHKNELAFTIEHLPFTEAQETGALEDAPSSPENGQWNLVNNQYHYRYPFIHYRIQKGQASIFALNDGIEAVQSVLSNNAWRIHWEGTPRPLLITGMQMQEYTLRVLPRPKTYKLFKWLALNAENYEKWQQCNSLVERIALLERILAAHILAFAGSVGWQLPERLEVNLQNLQRIETVRCHGIPMLAFNVSYTANVLLPPHIALGKAVSHGFGWQVPEQVHQNQQKRPRRIETEGLTKRTE